MKHLAIAVAALVLAAPAAASGYRVQVSPPPGGKLIRGHAGLHAVDEETATAKVRIVAPGTAFDKLGTVRVLVLNLGSKPFVFGPDQVRLKLADGTELKPVPLDKFDKGAQAVMTAMNRQAAIDTQVRNSLSMISQQSSGGMTAQSIQDVPGGGSAGSSAVDTNSLSRRTEDSLTPGSKTLDMIGQVLMPETVEPQKASGGYLVFELPKELRTATADIPLTIAVRTGDEEHRFTATLKHK